MKPWVMWFFPVFFFAFQFVFRLWPGLMMQSIMLQYSIDASQFGLLAACYYYGYAGLQIPVALWLEKYSARLMVSLFILVCALGCGLFTWSSTFYLACFSRFLVGAGSAVGFLGVSKVVSEWFSPSQYARMIGLSFSVGLLGAVYGGMPLTSLIERYGHKPVAYVLVLMTIGIAIGSYLVLRTPPRQTLPATGVTRLQALGTCLSSPILWCLALANLLMVGCLEGFADVWGVSYLMQVYQLTKPAAAGLQSFIFIGMLFGGPLLAFCSKYTGDYSVIAGCGVLISLAFSYLLIYPHFHPWLVVGVLFLLGILCCYQVIIFAAAAHLVPAASLGVTIAFLNGLNMLGGSFFHTVIGQLMGLHQELSAYKHALAIIPTCALLAALLVALAYRLLVRQR